MESEVIEQDQLLLVNSLLPVEVGLFRQKLIYSCLHVEGSVLAIGSEQGTVCVVDTQSRKLLREISESRTGVNLVKLCGCHSFVAIGFTDGVLAIVNYNKPTVKKVLREKDKSCITAFAWNEEGNGFFFGCKSGKLLSGTFDKDKGHIDTSHLLDCGSEVVQLSLQGSSLVVSSWDRSLLLQVDSGKLTQIGTRDRKPGPFGGCFISEDSIVVARPGLRLWIATTDGKVQSTAKFKDVLSNDLPAMTLFGGITTTTVINEGMQFDILVPWINQWIVCCHGNTVLVLEAQNLKCIGVMSIGQKIIDMCTHEADLYLLVWGHQRTLIKLSLPLPEPIKESKVLPVDLQSPLESSPPIQSVPIEQPIPSRQEVKDDIVGNTLEDDDAKDGVSTVKTDKEVPIIITQEVEGSSEVVVDTNEKQIDKCEDDATIEGDDRKDESGAKKVMSAVESRLHQVADLKGILTNPLGKLAALPRHDSPKEDDKPKQEEPLPTAPLSTVEAERRMRMLEIRDEEDGVAVRGTKKKKKRKTKKKHSKHTPLSSTHSSLETLNSILTENEEFPELVEGDFNMQEADSLLSLPLEDIVTEDVKIPDTINSDTKPADDTQSMVQHKVEDPLTEIEVAPADDTICEKETPNEVNDTRENDNTLCEFENDKLEVEERERIESVSKPNDPESENITNICSSPMNEDKTHRHETDLYSDLNKIWSSEDYVPTPPRNEETITQSSPDATTCKTRVRANAVRIDQGNLLFQSTSKSDLFIDDDEEDGEYALLSYTSEMKEDDSTATLTRSNANRTFNRDRTPTNTANPLPLPDVGERQMIKSRHSSHSHSVSSSYSIEEASSHPLSSGVSDSDTEDDDYTTQRRESVIASDYYSLVDGLTTKTNETGMFERRDRAEAFVPPVQEPIEDEGEGIDPPKADSWEILSQPSRYAIQSVCLSTTSLWLIDAKSYLYWSHAIHKGQTWQGLKKRISCISSSSDGAVVWGVYHHQAYVRHGINEMNPAGSSWHNVTRSESVSRKIKFVSCDSNAVWAVTTDGRVLFRRGVSKECPEGKVWMEARSSNTFVQVSSSGGIVWALDVSSRTYIRENVCEATPSGTRWRDVKSPSHFTAIAILRNGLVWGVDGENRLWFRCGATPLEPEGSGHWWEAIIGTLSKPSVASIVNSVWKVRSTESRSGSFLHNVTSKLVNSATNNKFIALSACAEAGICLLSADNELHACWNPVTGYHRQLASTEPIFTITSWKQCASFNNILWAIREDGELYCFPTTDKSQRIECQDQVRVLSASPSAVWALTPRDIWSRQGICEEIPQGYSWDYIELGSHMQSLKVKHLAIGNNVAWAVDNHGKLHFRFGIHPREPGTGMAPAWIEVPDQQEGSTQRPPIVFESIVVSPDDWLVWALDQNGTPYVRKGVTTSFPVGKHWEVVKGEKIKSVTAGSSKIFAITVNGELLRRKPITEGLPAGIYWRKLPGKFDLLSASPVGDLWLIGEKGLIYKQKSKVVLVDSHKEKEALEQCYEEDWEQL